MTDQWQLVPVEPTEEMMKAGIYQSSHDSTSADVHSIWKDMLAAAPTQGADARPVASNADKLLDALIDIYDDAQNNAPEDQCYVEGAWAETLAEARVYIATRDATPRAPLGWVWERRYSNGGYTRKFCTSEFEARELEKDGDSLPHPDLVYPFFSDAAPRADAQDAARWRYAVKHWLDEHIATTQADEAIAASAPRDK